MRRDTSRNGRPATSAARAPSRATRASSRSISALPTSSRSVHAGSAGATTIGGSAKIAPDAGNGWCVLAFFSTTTGGVTSTRSVSVASVAFVSASVA